MGFESLYGHQSVKKSLTKMLKEDRISNSYVFEGIAGVGKKTCADLFAMALVCEHNDKSARPCGVCSACVKVKSYNHPDIIRLTAADKASIGVDDIREQILNEVYLKPYLSNRRVFVIGEGDLLSVEAQNALLKVLEEPPENVTFLLCVTKQDKLLDTVLSRSFVVNFFPLSAEEIALYLNTNYPDKEDRSLAARISCGSIGTAVQFLSEEQGKTLFYNSVAHVLALARDASKIRETADFMIEEKDHVLKITDYISTFLRDCVFVKQGLKDRVIYQNKLSDMRVFCENISLKGLVSAFDRVADFKRKRKQNLNYNATVLETVMRIWEDFHDKSSGHSL